jgi:sarcosine oxidase subunit beta
VVVNAAGPFSAKVNSLAGVLSDSAVLKTRALRQEVHVLPGPEAFGLGSGGTVVMDADLGTYFRPHLGGTILVGGLEPECDPLVWVDDPDDFDPNPSIETWEAQTYRLARRLPDLGVPAHPRGLAALYDVTADWLPVYDRTSLEGFFVAVGTSGNQFKNAPMVGRFLSALIVAWDNGQDHDREPVRLMCEFTGNEVNLGHYSRLRSPADSTHSVLG